MFDTQDKISCISRRLPVRHYKDFITWVGWYTLLLEYQAVVLTCIYPWIIFRQQKASRIVTITNIDTRGYNRDSPISLVKTQNSRCLNVYIAKS